MTLRKLMITLGALLMAACAHSPAPSADAPQQATGFRRGVNVLGYDPIWKDPARGRFQARHFTEIKGAGFDFVRVNLHSFDHLDSANRISPQWLDRLDWVVREAT